MAEVGLGVGRRLLLPLLLLAVQALLLLLLRAAAREPRAARREARLGVARVARDVAAVHNDLEGAVGAQPRDKLGERGVAHLVRVGGRFHCAREVVPLGSLEGDDAQRPAAGAGDGAVGADLHSRRNPRAARRRAVAGAGAGAAKASVAAAPPLALAGGARRGRPRSKRGRGGRERLAERPRRERALDERERALAEAHQRRRHALERARGRLVRARAAGAHRRLEQQRVLGLCRRC